MSRFAVLLLGLAMAAPALAQTSQFDALANGTPQAVPMQVRDDLRKPEGRAVITIMPDAITTGSQGFLGSERWRFWLWRDELHAALYEGGDRRRLVRIDQDPEGVQVVAGQPFTFEVNWSAAGTGIFVAGELRAYLGGDHRLPDDAVVYGSSPNGGSPFNGAISVDVFAAPRSYDPCSNYPAWGTVQKWNAAGTETQGPTLIEQPTCTPVPDPDQEPTPIVNGEANFTVSWTLPTENEDGSPLAPADIAGYVMYWDIASRAGRCGAQRPLEKLDNGCYGNALDLADGTLSSAPLTLNLDQDTTFYFAMATYVVIESAGEPDRTLLSRYSNEVAKPFELVIDEPEPEPDPVPGSPTIESVDVEVSCEVDDARLTCTFRTP